MGKLIFILIIVFLAYWIIKNRQHEKNKLDTPPPDAIEDMVRCAYCGIHLPKSESIASENKFFCSEDHQRQYTHSS